MDIGIKIKSLRETQGMTLEDLGQKVGVGKSTVRKWETGIIANMRRDKISKLADALGVSPAYLMGWEESETAADLILSPEEESVIIGYRKADFGTRSSVRKLLDVKEDLPKSEAG